MSLGKLIAASFIRINLYLSFITNNISITTSMIRKKNTASADWAIGEDGVVNSGIWLAGYFLTGVFGLNLNPLSQVVALFVYCMRNFHVRVGL